MFLAYPDSDVPSYDESSLTLQRQRSVRQVTSQQLARGLVSSVQRPRTAVLVAPLRASSVRLGFWQRSPECLRRRAPARCQ